MSYKLKQDSIPGFSAEAAAIVCDNFFGSHERATGKSLTSMTRSEQANAFLIKSLLDQWRVEMRQLKSPYFDFEHKKVQKALKEFMNVLSHHISVAREDLEPLVKAAIHDTILVTFLPEVYLDELRKARAKLPLKHIKVRKAAFTTFADKQDKTALKGEAPISAEDFTALFGLDTKQLFEKETENFFDSLDIDEEEDVVLAPEEEVPVVEAPVAEAPVAEAPVIEEPVFEAAVEPEPEVAPVESPVVVEDVLNSEPVATDAKAEGETINDRFNGNGKKQTLADKLKQKVQKGIESSLTLNEKIMFVNSLFEGDKAKMTEALADLDTASDLDEAKVKAYKYGENWDMESDAVEAFFEVIENRYS